ncbi:MAG: AAA family ATPase [Bryobacterales bacterium]|nr:AAA family ATPase [Bryobacterales bacterium]
MNRLRLPIGVQNFQRLRARGCYYADKTPLIRQLVDQGDYYFLSRPRRFGKSLLVDTFHELFAGNEPLFRGLHIHRHWDWSEAHPVVHLNFGGQYDEPGNLASNVHTQLHLIERRAGFDNGPKALTGPDRLGVLIDHLHTATGRQVVVLVDEYDKPILDVLENPDLAIANRDYLRGFYGAIKACARHVRFVFVTGVSMFSRASLFSGLKNLEDISLDPQFSTICGYTDRDLNTVFAPELRGLDRDEIRTWYDGYRWAGMERLYNPIDLLLLFRTRKFASHWCETGTPDFLHRLMVERNLDPLQVENSLIDARNLSRFDVGDIDLRALMFQTGYLTIAGEERRGSDTLYSLEYPNLAVRQSFNQDMLAHLGHDGGQVSRQGHELLELLESNDFDGFTARLQAYLAGLPHQWRTGGNLGQYESHSAAMLYMTFCAVGADVRAEESSSRGRADLVLQQGQQVFMFELKVAGQGSSAQAAMERAIRQMRERGYAEKYAGGGEPVHLIGAVFGRETRNLLAIRTERL